MKTNKILQLTCILFLAAALYTQAASAADWKTLTTITGSADQTSSTFKIIAQEWRLHWSYQPDSRFPELCFFGIAIFEEGNPLMVDSFFSNGSLQLSGDQYLHIGNSSFYLEILDANIPSYTIVIQQDQETTTIPIVEGAGTADTNLIITITAVVIIVVAAAIGTVLLLKKNKKQKALTA
jgi:hypothetical protein